MRNMVTSVILYERIRTTKKRAQVMRPILDTVITMGKTLPTGLAIRRLSPYLCDENASKKILEVLKERYKTRTSGFSKMIPVGMRHGDGAKLVDVVLMDAVFGADALVEKKEEATTEKAAPAPKKKSSPSKKTTVAKKKASA